MVKINLFYRFQQLDSLTSDTCRELKYASQELYKQTVECFLNLRYLYSRFRKRSRNKFRKLNDDFFDDGNDTEILENTIVEGTAMENTVVQEQPTDAKVQATNTIHFVDGEKGGVGKSLFCRVLLEYGDSRGYSDRN
ncbi:MAG: hypothetical protein WBB28_14060 [Crinalium sp.]